MQVYFAPRPKAMECFETLTKHGRFVKTIKHLVYDDTQLAEQYLDLERFLCAIEDFHKGTLQEQKRAHIAYCSLFHEQQRIVTAEEDRTVLWRGLFRLPKLSKISVIGGPSRIPGSTWYFDKQSGPHAQDFAGTALGASFWSYHTKFAKKYHQWDASGFHNLIDVLAGLNIRPVEVHIGNWQVPIGRRLPLKMGLPLSSFRVRGSAQRGIFMELFDRVLVDVTSLNLQLDMRQRTLDQHYTSQDLETIYTSLPAMRNLSRLSIGFTHWNLHSDDSQHLFRPGSWPALTYLKVRNMEFDPDRLLKFLAGRKNTLKEIHLHGVGFSPDSNHTWEDFIVRCRPLLALQHVVLNVYQGRTNSQGRRVRHNLASEELMKLLLGTE